MGEPELGGELVGEVEVACLPFVLSEWKNNESREADRDRCDPERSAGPMGKGRERCRKYRNIEENEKRERDK